MGGGYLCVFVCKRAYTILQKRGRQRRMRSVLQIKSGDLYICTTLDKWHFSPFKSPSHMPRKIQTEYKIMSQPSILVGGQDKIKPNIYYFIFLAKTNFQHKQTNGITWSSLDLKKIFSLDYFCCFWNPGKWYHHSCFALQVNFNNLLMWIFFAGSKLQIQSA